MSKQIYNVLQNYELFFGIFSDTNAEYLNKYGVDGGQPLTRQSVLKFLDSQNEYVKYATNENDKEIQYTFDYLREIYYQPINSYIIVWLGTRDFVYQNSARVVTIKDLEILSKSSKKDFLPEPKNRYRFYRVNKYYFNNRKYRRSKASTYSQHSYGKSLSRNANNIKDYFDEYPILKNKRYKEFNEYHHRLSWDFYDYQSKYKNNGWKDNTKHRKQYLKNLK